MVCWKTNQILWYFYQVITDKYNIMEHNNSPRSIMKNQSFDMIYSPYSGQ